MFSFNLNVSSPAELSAYLEIIKASGLPLQAASARLAINAPDASGDALATLYKAKTGKGRASLTGAELSAIGCTGAPSAEDKASAMRATLEREHGMTAEDIQATTGGKPEEQETGATYEPEGETATLEDMSAEDY